MIIELGLCLYLAETFAMDVFLNRRLRGNTSPLLSPNCSILTPSFTGTQANTKEWLTITVVNTVEITCQASTRKA